MGHSARRFVGWMCTHAKFPGVFAGPENGFVAAKFCFVTPGGMKHCRLAQGRRADPEAGSLADRK
jgi:hypothetical protein